MRNTMTSSSDRMRLKDKIITNVARAIKGIHEYQLCSGEVVLTNDTWHCHRLCEHLDHAFLHGLRHITHGYWRLVTEFTRKEAVKEIKNLQRITTDLGRGRAWLFLALNENSLESYMRCFLENSSVVKKYYVREALVLDEQRMNVLVTLTSGLDFASFQLEYDLPYLDLSASPPKTRSQSNAAAAEEEDKVSLCSMESFASRTSLSAISSSMIESTVTATDSDCGSVNSDNGSSSCYHNSSTNGGYHLPKAYHVGSLDSGYYCGAVDGTASHRQSRGSLTMSDSMSLSSISSNADECRFRRIENVLPTGHVDGENNLEVIRVKSKTPRRKKREPQPPPPPHPTSSASSARGDGGGSGGGGSGGGSGGRGVSGKIDVPSKPSRHLPSQADKNPSSLKKLNSFPTTTVTALDSTITTNTATTTTTNRTKPLPPLLPSTAASLNRTTAAIAIPPKTFSLSPAAPAAASVAASAVSVTNNTMANSLKSSSRNVRINSSTPKAAGLASKCHPPVVVGSAPVKGTLSNSYLKSVRNNKATQKKVVVCDDYNNDGGDNVVVVVDGGVNNDGLQKKSSSSSLSPKQNSEILDNNKTMKTATKTTTKTKTRTMSKTTTAAMKKKSSDIDINIGDEENDDKSIGLLISNDKLDVIGDNRRKEEQRGRGGGGGRGGERKVGEDLLGDLNLSQIVIRSPSGEDDDDEEEEEDDDDEGKGEEKGEGEEDKDGKWRIGNNNNNNNNNNRKNKNINKKYKDSSEEADDDDEGEPALEDSEEDGSSEGCVDAGEETSLGGYNADCSSSCEDKVRAPSKRAANTTAAVNDDDDEEDVAVVVDDEDIYSSKNHSTPECHSRSAHVAPRKQVFSDIFPADDDDDDDVHHHSVDQPPNGLHAGHHRPPEAGQIVIDNHILLYLMLEIFEENEKFLKMFVTREGQNEGQTSHVFVVITARSIYLLKQLSGDQKFVKESCILFHELDYISLSLNSQVINLVCANRRRKFWLTTGDEEVTRSIINCLCHAMETSLFNVPKLSVLTDATSQQIAMKKYIAQETKSSMHDVELHSYQLIHWEDAQLPSSQGEWTYKEGYLLHRYHDYFRGFMWKPGYFVLKDGSLSMYNNKTDSKPTAFINMGIEDCTGCRRATDSDRENTIEIVLANGDYWYIAADTPLEANQWQQSFCQAASEIMLNRGSISNSCIGCCVLLSQNKLLMCHEDLQTNFFRTLGSANLEDVTAILQDHHNSPYCILEFESQEDGVSTEQWILYFNSDKEKTKFMDKLLYCWKKMFQLDLPVNKLDNVQLRMKCKRRVEQLTEDLALL